MEEHKKTVEDMKEKDHTIERLVEEVHDRDQHLIDVVGRLHALEESMLSKNATPKHYTNLIPSFWNASTTPARSAGVAEEYKTEEVGPAAATTTDLYGAGGVSGVPSGVTTPRSVASASSSSIRHRRKKRVSPCSHTHHKKTTTTTTTISPAVYLFKWFVLASLAAYVGVMLGAAVAGLHKPATNVIPNIVARRGTATTRASSRARHVPATTTTTFAPFTFPTTISTISTTPTAAAISQAAQSFTNTAATLTTTAATYTSAAATNAANAAATTATTAAAHISTAATATAATITQTIHNLGPVTQNLKKSLYSLAPTTIHTLPPVFSTIKRLLLGRKSIESLVSGEQVRKVEDFMNDDDEISMMVVVYLVTNCLTKTNLFFFLFPPPPPSTPSIY